MVNLAFAEGYAAKNATLEIMNMQGQIVKTTTVNAGATSMSIDVSDLAKGGYIIRLKSNEDFTVKYLVIE